MTSDKETAVVHVFRRNPIDLLADSDTRTCANLGTFAKNERVTVETPSPEPERAVQWAWPRRLHAASAEQVRNSSWDSRVLVECVAES